jgi:hypothetical protein
MAEEFKTGDRVQVFLDSKFWKSEGWFAGTVIRIDPYSQRRSFYWVELDDDVEALPGKGTKLISVLNPKNIKKI